jgi:hypothetical protein
MRKNYRSEWREKVGVFVFTPEPWEKSQEQFQKIFQDALSRINEEKIDINMREKKPFHGRFGNSVLHEAVHNVFIEGGIFVVQNKDEFHIPFEIHSQDAEGMTPLMSAVMKGYKKCAENICVKEVDDKEKPAKIFYNKDGSIFSRLYQKKTIYKRRLGELIDEIIKNTTFSDVFEIKNKENENVLEIMLKLYDINSIIQMVIYHKQYFMNKVLEDPSINHIITNYYGDEINFNYINTNLKEHFRSDPYRFSYYITAKHKIPKYDNKLTTPELTTELKANKQMILQLIKFLLLEKFLEVVESDNILKNKERILNILLRYQDLFKVPSFQGLLDILF